MCREPGSLLTCAVYLVALRSLPNVELPVGGYEGACGHPLQSGTLLVFRRSLCAWQVFAVVGD